MSPQELADFYQKIADGGIPEYRHSPRNDWQEARSGPDLETDDIEYRIRPEPKVVFMDISPSGMIVMSDLSQTEGRKREGWSLSVKFVEVLDD